ncbi:hypothetical protein Desaci_0911 [Desulfosporosinus acidiphilus SJ4]|uniref:Uncharacterized protein n=1 Tax=Desulfosporosinus acidiphilus (strain DSM 22704 / JCM 16185 / SJ4) TaxID=646529 RepID=I4D2D3_DESAJ|nr:hypothetical protein [Desulfosporosinus acidiphilus]AFM39957.1 hypothetical protein Desaci_0911 [Desulfosporosinus acidiphilus SJ4]
MKVSIYPISEERKGDFLQFFDNVAFTDNKEWSGCYCQFYHFDDEQWQQQTEEKNRLSAIKLIQEDRMKGFNGKGILAEFNITNPQTNN